MDPFTAGALINTGGSIIQNAFNSAATKKQNQYNIDMWNRNNEYNSIENQMKRFKEAGLNPHLIYGQGTAGNSAAAPEKKSYSPDVSVFSNIVDTYLTLKKKDTEIENTKQDTKLKDVNTRDRWIDYSLNSAINDQRTSEAWLERESDEQFMPSIRKYMAGLEGDLKMNKKTDATTRQINASKDNLLKDLEIKNITDWIPKAEERRYREFGILQGDGDDIQIIKFLYKAFTGEKLEDTNKGGKAMGLLSLLKSFKTGTPKPSQMEQFGKWSKSKWKEGFDAWRTSPR